ncbi:MAG: VWA domain-containing protein [Acidobacteriota bacterium]|nr:MAG: VWA domain-containing protein [Acidobacteriota bacterium]
MYLRLIAWVICSCLAASPLFGQSGQVVFILDGSNSMWGRVGDVEKIVVARQGLTQVLAGLPDTMDIGLAAYGHRREGACDDIELMLYPGKHEQADVERAILRIEPKGMTPITSALQMIADRLDSAKDPTHLVLVSDGKETCEGDPCTLVRTLRERRADLKVHVVGFDVTEEERSQLQCIAGAGGGVFAGAATPEELMAALQVIRETVAAEADSQAESTAVFSDREDPYWIVRAGDTTYEGDISFVNRKGDQLAVQLVNRDAVNVGFIMPASGNEGQISDSFLVIGRGQPCRIVASESPAFGRWSKDGDWLVGSFSCELACADYRLLSIRGEFRIPARGEWR